MSSWRCFPFVDSTPRAYRLKASNAAPSSSTSTGTFPREGLLTAFLAAFGRAIAEVGAIIIVGGNIRGYTRSMTTTIALETSRGDLSLALGLGLILLSLSVTISTVAFLLVARVGEK